MSKTATMMDGDDDEEYPVPLEEELSSPPSSIDDYTSSKITANVVMMECPICYEEIRINNDDESCWKVTVADGDGHHNSNEHDDLRKRPHHHHQQQQQQDDNNKMVTIQIDDQEEEDKEETGANTAAVAVSITASCKEHKFCSECLKLHCIHSINDKNIPIKCPSNNCTTVLHDKQVHDLLCPLVQQHSQEQKEHDYQHCCSTETWIKYQRYQQLTSDPNLLECPQCDTILSGKLNNPPTNIKCIACSHMFCSKHYNKHLGLTCIEYEKSKKYKKDRKNERKSKKFISKNSKPCSRCNMPIEKSGGCDHIICPSCHEDFCYKCGTHVYLSGSGTVRTCSKCKQGYIDHRKIIRYRLCLLLRLPCLLPCLIINTLCTILYVIGSCFMCCCFKCGTLVVQSQQQQQHEQGSNSCMHKLVLLMNGIRFVFGYIFLSFIDLLDRLCGLQCCGETFITDVLKSVRNFETGGRGGGGGAAATSSSSPSSILLQVNNTVDEDDDDEEDNSNDDDDDGLFDKV